MERKVIKTFDKPTDIVIFGGSIKGNWRNHELIITDGETSFEIKTENDSFSCLCDGSISVITLDEYKHEVYTDYQGYNPDNEEEQIENFFGDAHEAYYLKHFVGEVAVKITSNKTYIDLEKINLNDYICHQPGTSVLYDVEVELHLPNCNIRNITEENFMDIVVLEKRRDILNELNKI